MNVVNPDAVLRGSKIWEGEWLEQRSSTYGVDKKGLEEMYRNRSLLKLSVFKMGLSAFDDHLEPPQSPMKLL